MDVRITTAPAFERSLKRLAKHYASMRDDYAALLDSLRRCPNTGTQLGGKLRKVRMPITSKEKGKSAGARVITYTFSLTAEETLEIRLLYIYDKSERSTLTDKELKTLAESCGF